MTIEISFPSADGQAELNGIWHPPTSRATNSALIVLQNDLIAAWLCEGAAAQGLTALRFEPRYLAADGLSSLGHPDDNFADLVGAYGFLDSFGLEIKPRRIYLVGAAVRGLVALGLARQPQYQAGIKGVAVMGLPLHTDYPLPLLPSGLPGLRASLLIIQSAADPHGNPAEIQTFLNSLAVPTQLEIITEANYDPYNQSGPVIDQPPNDADLGQKVVQLTLDWLTRHEAARPELRI